MRTAFLWIHVVGGVVWILASAAIAIAANILTPNSGEFRDFAVRAVPRLNWISLLAAAAVALTGIGNLVIIGIPVGFALPVSFTAVLVLKILLFIAMSIALVGVVRSQAGLIHAVESESMGWGTNRMIRIGILCAMIAVMGAAALTLGLWLMGSL